MPKIEVNGVNIAYEILGKGIPIVWTNAGFAQRNPFAYTCAGRLSANNQVLIWDRPNTGQSDFFIKDTPSEWHMWAEILHEMCSELKLLPAFFGGGSVGSELALLMAHLYPEDG